MNRILLTSISALLLAATLLPDVALAEGGVVENVVVRNRKYMAKGHLEVTPSVGFTLTSNYTSHTMLGLGVAYSPWETVGFEVRGNFAQNSLTSVATDVRTSAYQDSPWDNGGVNAQKDDFANLWRVKWDALLLPRWTPIYGKLNLVTELPIHFQAYLTAGAGAAGLERDSLVYCQDNFGGSNDATQPSLGRPAACASYLHEAKTSPVAAVGGGMKFYASSLFQLKLELMDLTYPDTYRTKINRQQAEAEKPGASPNNSAKSEGHGLTSLFFLNIGASFTF